MPLCLVVTVVTGSDGVPVEVLTPYAGQSGPVCPGGFALSPAEFDQFTALTESGSGSSLPPTDQLSAAWGAGFSLVVGCYLIGWAVGAVVNFLKGSP